MKNFLDWLFSFDRSKMGRWSRAKKDKFWLLLNGLFWTKKPGWGIFYLKKHIFESKKVSPGNLNRYRNQCLLKNGCRKLPDPPVFFLKKSEKCFDPVGHGGNGAVRRAFSLLFWGKLIGQSGPAIAADRFSAPGDRVGSPQGLFGDKCCF